MPLSPVSNTVASLAAACAATSISAMVWGEEAKNCSLAERRSSRDFNARFSCLSDCISTARATVWRICCALKGLGM